MSAYWSNHVEEYDEIVRQAEADWLGSLIAEGGYADHISMDDNTAREFLLAVIDALRPVHAYKPWPDCPNFHRDFDWIMSSHANRYICDREADYWGSKH